MAASQPDWDSTAAGRDRWHRKLSDALAPLEDRVMQLAGIQRGMRVLDVGTGTGEPALSAARRVGPEGHVVGVDSSPAMITVAEERAAALGLGNVTFKVMDAQEMSFNEQFDAVLCQLVMMFLPDHAAVLARMQDSLLPGGKAAVAVLGPLETTPMIWIWARALNADNQKMPGASGHPGEPSKQEPDPFRFADRNDLAAALGDAGFSDVATETLSVELDFESFDQFAEFQIDTRPDVKAALAVMSTEERSRVLARVRDHATRFTDLDGRVRIITAHHLATGRRPTGDRRSLSDQSHSGKRATGF